MIRRQLSNLKIEKELSEDLGIIADADSRSKVDEIRFLIKERKNELIKNGGLIISK